MVQGRFGPLIALVALVVIVLCARLFQVQVLQHDVWAGEAARLVRSGLVVPYKRGAILDAKQRPIAWDEPACGVEFCYRDFRRGHPLAQVAHALSSLEGRTVPLAEALADLRANGNRLAALSPALLAAFARGEGIALAGRPPIPPSADPERDQRAARAADVRFYVQALLEFTLADRKALSKELGQEHEIASYAEFVASQRKTTAAGVLGALDARLDESARDLERLAALLPAEPGSAQRLAGRELVARLENWRARVEDDAADELFLQTCGFTAGRVEPAVLERCVDLEWLAHVLRWDDARTHAWLAGARADWRAKRDTWQVGALLAELQLAPADEARADVLLFELAALFAAPAQVRRAREEALERGGRPDVRALADLAVMGELDSLFEAAVPAEAREAGVRLLPFQSAQLEPIADGWERAGALEALSRPGAVDAAASALAWREEIEERVHTQPVGARVLGLLDAWEGPFQAQIAREIEGALAAADDDEKSSAGRLLVDRERIALAGEQIPYILKDRGTRPVEVEDHPGYDLVWLLSRHRDRYPGFSVRGREDRKQLADANGIPAPIALLLGRVTQPDLVDLGRQRHEARELSGLLRQGRRSEDESQRLRELMARVDRPGELRGSEGLEGYFDPELSGANGYRENRGLEEQEERDEDEFDLAARDGEDVVLTIDLDLQRAAEQVLASPDGDPEESAKTDEDWIARPVGAIVLLTPDGDVLAAASVPGRDRGAYENANDRDLRDRAIDRTLRLLDNQPPGSVIKPLWAAWALDRIKLDPRKQQVCEPHDGDTANYRGLHCSHENGHGPVGLRRALEVSCNCYFAWLGEQLEPELLMQGAHEFGFGEPTGLRSQGPRPGLREDYWQAAAKQKLRNQHEQRLFGNGLSVVQATPMQVARAYAGLATGALPELRIARSLGGREVEKRSRPLDISPQSLAFVRSALLDVTAGAEGTAHRALNPQALGFSMAAKTGSADYKKGRQGAVSDGDKRVRKHTWLAGWFPAEKPVAIVVVFEFDTVATSSYGVVWVARQFLQRPEVRALIDAAGSRG